MSVSPRRQGFRETSKRRGCFYSPSIYHAAVVIFLEFFAFGLLTSPMISILDEAFPKHTFLMNGLIQGVKGFLSFLSAPLIGALSDIFGRKPFLLLTVTFTCSPIPFIKLSHWWYFTLVSISGIFSVTFSVVLAFVSDVTTVENRSWAYGFVSATFAASLIISPSLGSLLEKAYSESFVITLASLIALSDVLFILFCIPESLKSIASSGGGSHNCDGCTPCGPLSTSNPSICVNSGGQVTVERRWAITWDKVDPFGALRHISRDRLTLLVCMTTFLSYLPEAGEYSCFFVYLRLVMGFSEEKVALFIAICGLFSCIAQTCGLGLLISCLGAKQAIIVGLVFEACQLVIFGFFSSAWILWSAGCVAGLGSITYPALSAFLSNHVKADQQGLTQGLLTGIRGLCGGLGPAVYGFIFFIFQVDLNYRPSNLSLAPNKSESLPFQDDLQVQHQSVIPGPPFAFGAFLALMAILVAVYIPENRGHSNILPTASGPSPFANDDVKSRRMNRELSLNTESTANLLLTFQEKELERSAFSDQEEEEYHPTFASNATDRRKRLRDSRHHRQPSDSKVPRPPLSNASHAFLPTKLTNPLRRIFFGDPRQRSHTSQPYSLPSASYHFFDDQQTQEAQAADLANFRVSYKLSEAVIAGGSISNEGDAPLLTNSPDFVVLAE